MKPLLVFAMKEESANAFDGHDVLHCGIGKVNAAYALTRRLAAGPKPPLVVNLGTAGSRKHKAGIVVNPRRFVQRDMDVTALGFAKYQTPFSDDPAELEYGESIDALPGGVCGSGDSFATGDEAAHFDVLDMEAYAIAVICQREKLNFLCLKYISDGADGAAHKEWADSLQHAAASLKSRLEQYVRT